MYMHDKNPDKKETILIIHPGFSSAEGLLFRFGPYLGDQYRCLVPDLNGHGDAIKQTYISADEEAKQIHDYLVKNQIFSIQLGYCASLGGCVMFKLLKYPDIHFEHVLFEGASLYENAPILDHLIRTIYLMIRRNAIKNPDSLRKRLAAMYGEEASIPMAKSFTDISEESIRNLCHDCAHVELVPLSEEMQRRLVFTYGEKDSDLKNTKKQLPKHYPKAELKVWAGFGHCERISKDSKAYCQMLKQYL